jgi:hypothetical protein
MNIEDDTYGWVYAFEVSASIPFEQVPEGAWTAFGYSGGADGTEFPAFVTHGESDLPRPSPVLKKSDLVVLDPSKEHNYTAADDIPISRHRVGQILTIGEGEKPVKIRGMLDGRVAYFGTTEVRRIMILLEKHLLACKNYNETLQAFCRGWFGDNKSTKADFIGLNPVTFCSKFDNYCLKRCTEKIDGLRGAFNWPRHNQQPKPPDGCNVLTLKRPEKDDTNMLKVWNPTFREIGVKSGMHWQKGFMIKYGQDEGVDWGALTKGWANMMASDVFRHDSALFAAALSPGTDKQSELSTLPFFFMPDWCSRITGSDTAEIRTFMEFTGRWFGYCIYMFCRLDANIAPYLFRILLEPDPELDIAEVGDAGILECAEKIQLNLDDKYFPGPKWASAAQAIDDLETMDPHKASAMKEVLY